MQRSVELTGTGFSSFRVMVTLFTPSTSNRNCSYRRRLYPTSLRWTWEQKSSLTEKTCSKHGLRWMKWSIAPWEFLMRRVYLCGYRRQKVLMRKGNTWWWICYKPERLFEKSDKSASRAAVQMYFEHFSNRLWARMQCSRLRSKMIIPGVRVFGSTWFSSLPRDQYYTLRFR